MVKAFGIASFSLFMLLFALPTAKAQEVSSDTLDLRLDTLTVQAVRSNISAEDAPLSLAIKTRSLQEMASSGSASLTSLTEGMPGIWINDRHNDALGERITIRGIGWRAAFGVRGIQVVLDGIPLTVADGQSVTNIIDPALIRRVELIRGPAASYWGNSSGGVLYLSTQPDYTDDKTINLRMNAGSYNQKNVHVQFKQDHGKHNVSAYTSYNYTNGYRNYSASKILHSGLQGQIELSDRDRLQYLGALLWMPEAQHPSGLTAPQVDEKPRQANASYVDAEAGKNVTQGQLGLTFNHQINNGIVTLSSYGIYRDLANPLPFGIITVDRLAGGARGTLGKDIGDLTLHAGAELKYQHDDREEFENNDGNRGATTVNQLEKVSNQALFLTVDYAPGAMKILGSLRYDRITFSTDSASNIQSNSRSFHSISPAVGLGYQAGNSTLYTNLSTSFEAPTTTELVNRPGGGNGFNPDLKPEQTVGLEAGSRGTFGHGLIEYDLSLYQLWIRDLLFPYQLEPNGPTFYRNQGETGHKGIEASASLHPGNDVTMQLSYNLTDAKFLEAQTLDSVSLKGKSVPGVARHRFSGRLKWTPASFWMELNGRYVSSYPVNNINSARNDAYFITDIKLSYQKIFAESGVTMIPFINVNNIFDRKYNGSVVVNASGARYYEPAPGRNWHAGITLQF